MLWLLILLLTLVLLVLALRFLSYRGRRYNQDGSFRVQFAPKSAQEEDLERIFPFQKLENLPDKDYPRTDGNSVLRVPILPQEALFGQLTMWASAYTRVYFLEQCTDNDIAILKASLSKALGAWPILCGRRDGDTIVLPISCLTLEEDDDDDADPKITKNLTSPNPSFGVPFRVYKIQDESETPDITQPLSPKDAVRYSVFEEPKRVLQGKASLLNICIYKYPNGSATLSIWINHCAMDGTAASKFEELWTRECRKLMEVQTTSSIALHKPLEQVAPVNRHDLPGPFEDLKEYRQAQMDLFGKVFDKGTRMEGTMVQRFLVKLVLNLLPIFIFMEELLFVWEIHAEDNRNHVIIPGKKIQQLKQELKPNPPDWIASQDTVIAAMVQQTVQALQEDRKYKKRRIRVVVFRDARPYLGLASNHAFGVGVLFFPIDIDNPHEKSLGDIALEIRKGLLRMNEDQRAVRMWRLQTTIYSNRLWSLPAFGLAGLFDFGKSDKFVMLNNCMFPLPDFGGSMGRVENHTTSAGPTMLLSEAEGGCRIFVEGGLADTLTQNRIDGLPDIRSLPDLELH